MVTGRRCDVGQSDSGCVELSSGATTLRFGAANAGAEVTGLQWNFGKSVAGSVMSRPETVWWGWIATPAVQEWSVAGELLRDFDGDLPWFPEIYETPDRAREPPETLLLGLALDGDDNLWMMIMESSADEPPHPVEGIRRVGHALHESGLHIRDQHTKGFVRGVDGCDGCSLGRSAGEFVRDLLPIEVQPESQRTDEQHDDGLADDECAGNRGPALGDDDVPYVRSDAEVCIESPLWWVTYWSRALPRPLRGR